jgi:hypothetical protein
MALTQQNEPLTMMYRQRPKKYELKSPVSDPGFDLRVVAEDQEAHRTAIHRRIQRDQGPS